MAVNALYENSALIATTEYSLVTNSTVLAADTNQGVFQFLIDFNALAGTDRYECKIYEKVVSGGTQRIVSVAYFAPNAAEPIALFPAMVLMHGWDVTLKRVGGTSRTIAWSLRQLT